MHKPRMNRAAAILLLLAACGSSNEPEEQGSQGSGATAAGDSGNAGNRNMIECATGGSADYRPACSVEEIQAEAGLTLVLRAPGGGFRRLLVTTDGRGVTAADGSEPAIVTPIGSDRIEVRIGGDRYRLPATVKGTGSP
jgi:hypothetical protein